MMDVIYIALVDRDQLLRVVENELQDSSLTVLLVMLYKNMKKMFNTLGGFTEWLGYSVGVKQACILPPRAPLTNMD